MICQECGSKPATLHFTKIVNGEKSEYHFCESCAREKGELIPGTANGFSIHNLLSGMLDFDPPAGALGQKQVQELRCDSCGMSYAQFSKIGRFGCSHCYHAFADKLDPLFRRIHGTTTHAGKIPKRSGGQIQFKRELSELKRQLQQLIEREEFEKAAQIRDRIRELEKRLARDGSIQS
jgi:protein arginine kinase activator